MRFDVGSTSRLAGSGYRRCSGAAAGKRICPRRKGLTLLEVAFAVSILSLVTLTAVTMIVPVSRQVRISRELETAVSAVRKVVERMQATPFGSITTMYSQGMSIAVPGLNSGNVSVSYADPTANPLFVQLTVSWASPDLGPMSKAFTTVRTE